MTPFSSFGANYNALYLEDWMHGTFYAFQCPLLKAHQSKLGNFIATQFCHIFERFFGTTPLCHTLIGRGQLLAHGSEVSGKDQFRNPNIGEIEPSIRSLRSGTGYGITEYYRLKVNWIA